MTNGRGFATMMLMLGSACGGTGPHHPHDPGSTGGMGPGAQAMRDPAGREIGPHDLWQATMMANSARDPFWWAMVRAETNASQTQPVLGEADADFVGGSDIVEYRVLAPAGAGPFEIEVSLGYQATDPRFAAELLALDAPEIRAFERMWEASERSPEPVASAAVVLP